VRWVVLLCGFALVCGFALALTGCSSSQSTSSADSPQGVSSDEIIVSELPFSVGGLSAYDLVSRHNSAWLRKRGPTSINNPNPINVYLDNTNSPYGTVEVLREIRAVNVASIRHFDAREAQFKFGLGNVSGAILVKTKGAGQ